MYPPLGIENLFDDIWLSIVPPNFALLIGVELLA